jgi:hypothetical protein
MQNILLATPCRRRRRLSSGCNNEKADDDDNDKIVDGHDELQKRGRLRLPDGATNKHQVQTVVKVGVVVVVALSIKVSRYGALCELAPFCGLIRLRPGDTTRRGPDISNTPCLDSYVDPCRRVPFVRRRRR